MRKRSEKWKREQYHNLAEYFKYGRWNFDYDPYIFETMLKDSLSKGFPIDYSWDYDCPQHYGSPQSIEKASTPTLLVLSVISQRHNADQFIRLLLDYGADPNWKDTVGKNVLMHCCYNLAYYQPSPIANVISNEMFEKLVSGTDDVNHQNNYGGTALYGSAQSYVTGYARTEEDPADVLPKTKILLEHGATVDFYRLKSRLSAHVNCSRIPEAEREKVVDSYIKNIVSYQEQLKQLEKVSTGCVYDYEI